MSQTYVLEREQFIPLPRETVFDFFSDAANLEPLTPPWLHFQIETPLPIAMREGALIDYRLRLNGIPIRWRTRIDRYEPAHCFVDQQIRGPYRRWHHLHEFHDQDGGTRMLDRVHYEIGWGPLGSFAHAVYVQRSLTRIFDFRRQVIAERLVNEENTARTGPS